MDTDADEWNALIKNRIDRSYLLQHFCKRPCIDVMHVNSGKIDNIPLMLGLFQTCGHFVGCYNRAGHAGVIDYKHGGIMVSTVRVRDSAGCGEGKRIHGCVC